MGKHDVLNLEKKTQFDIYNHHFILYKVDIIISGKIMLLIYTHISATKDVSKPETKQNNLLVVSKIKLWYI